MEGSKKRKLEKGLSMNRDCQKKKIKNGGEGKGLKGGDEVSLKKRGLRWKLIKKGTPRSRSVLEKNI